MEPIKFGGIGWGQNVKITEEIMTKGSQLPNLIENKKSHDIENKKSHDGIIVLLLISLISLYFIYNANIEAGCDGQSGPFDCIILYPLWWSCLFSTLLAIPFYAILYRFGKKRKDPWEI